MDLWNLMEHLQSSAVQLIKAAPLQVLEVHIQKGSPDGHKALHPLIEKYQKLCHIDTY